MWAGEFPSLCLLCIHAEVLASQTWRVWGAPSCKERCADIAWCLVSSGCLCSCLNLLHPSCCRTLPALSHSLHTPQEYLPLLGAQSLLFPLAVTPFPCRRWV